MTFRFKSHDCRLRWSRTPHSHRPALLLVDDRRPGVVVAVINLDLPGVRLATNEIAIKDFGSNSGALAALHEAWRISKPVRFVEVGQRSIPICKLLVDTETVLH